VFDRWYHALILYITGLVVKVGIDLVRHSLGSTIQNSGSILKGFANLLIVYLDAVFGVVLWVGLFNLLYAILGLYWWRLVSMLVFSTTSLMLMKAFHCSGGAPLQLATDEKIVVPSSYFGTHLQSDGILKVMGDTVFTYAVVHSLVVCTWWAMWELENRYIFYVCEITIKDIMAWTAWCLPTCSYSSSSQLAAPFVT